MGGGQFNKPGTVKGGVHVYACRVAMVTHGELWAFIHSVHVTVTLIARTCPVCGKCMCIGAEPPGPNLALQQER